MFYLQFKDMWSVDKHACFIGMNFNHRLMLQPDCGRYLKKHRPTQQPWADVDFFFFTTPVTSHHLAPIAEVLMRGGLGSARDPTAMLLGRSETRARLPRQKKLQWICFSMCVILFPCFSMFSVFL